MLNSNEHKLLKENANNDQFKSKTVETKQRAKKMKKKKEKTAETCTRLDIKNRCRNTIKIYSLLRIRGCAHNCDTFFLNLNANAYAI